MGIEKSEEKKKPRLNPVVRQELGQGRKREARIRPRGTVQGWPDHQSKGAVASEA